jgi:hypothetical protein
MVLVCSTPIYRGEQSRWPARAIRIRNAALHNQIGAKSGKSKAEREITLIGKARAPI